MAAITDHLASTSAQNGALNALVFDGPEPHIGIIIIYFVREIVTYCMGGSIIYINLAICAIYYVIGDDKVRLRRYWKVPVWLLGPILNRRLTIEASLQKLRTSLYHLQWSGNSGSDPLPFRACSSGRLATGSAFVVARCYANRVFTHCGNNIRAHP